MQLSVWIDKQLVGRFIGDEVTEGARIYLDGRMLLGLGDFDEASHRETQMVFRNDEGTMALYVGMIERLRSVLSTDTQSLVQGARVRVQRL